MGESHFPALLPEELKSPGCHKLLYLLQVRCGLQVLADCHHMAPGLPEIPEGLQHFLILFAKSKHDPRFSHQARVSYQSDYFKAPVVVSVVPD